MRARCGFAGRLRESSDGSISSAGSAIPTPSDATEVAALGRVEVRRVGALVRRQIRAGVVSTDDWRRLVELRVHGDSSSAIAERDGLSPAVVRKRAQRTLQALVAV